MINLWDYTSRRVEVECLDGERLVGDVIDVSAKEDAGDAEDSLSLELADGRIIGLFPSEIRQITIRE